MVCEFDFLINHQGPYMGKYDPEKHHRRSIRLQGYDYTSPGAYFITMVTQNRASLFGDISEGKMRLNEGGKITHQCWLDIPQHFPHASLDEFVIMPNHVHGILVISGSRLSAHSYNDVSARAKNLSPPNNHLTTNYNSPTNDIPVNDVGMNNNFGTEIGDEAKYGVWVNNNVGTKNFSSLRRPRGTSKTIGAIIRGFKIGVTKWFRQNTDTHVVWQRNYYEHIIRNDDELNKIRKYIIKNPLKWKNDQHFWV